MQNIKEILNMWRNSRVMHRIGTEYPMKASGFIGARTKLKMRRYLTEEEACIIDKAVLRLKRVNLPRYMVLADFYLHGKSCPKIASATNRTAANVRNTLSCAEAFIYGHIVEYLVDD